MQALTRFFTCCTKEQPIQPETTVYLTERRAKSVGNRTARIQRSTQKKKNFDGVSNHSQHLTLTISTHTQSTQKRIKQNRYMDSQNSPHSVKHHGLSLSLKPQKEDRYSPKNQINSPSHIKSIEKVINIDEKMQIKRSQPEKEMSDFQKIISNPQPPSIKAPAPRLLLERIKKSKKQQNVVQNTVERNPQNQKRKSQLNRKSPLIVSVLEPIEERLSLPSCTQSQIQDIHRNPSRSVFFHEGDRLPQISPLTQKHTSCTFNREGVHNSGIQSAKSEHFRQFEQKLSVEHEKLIQNKIKVDIEIHEKELRTLQQQERCLQNQAIFQREHYQKELNQLASVKDNLLKNIETFFENGKKKEANFEIKQENREKSVKEGHQY